MINKIYLEKCFGSKIVYNSLNSDNIGNNRMFKAISKKPELKNLNEINKNKVLSIKENKIYPNKMAIVQNSAGGGINFDSYKSLNNS